MYSTHYCRGSQLFLMNICILCCYYASITGFKFHFVWTGNPVTFGWDPVKISLFPSLSRIIPSNGYISIFSYKKKPQTLMVCGKLIFFLTLFHFFLRVNHTHRVSTNKCARWNITMYESPCRNNGIVSDGHTW